MNEKNVKNQKDILLEKIIMTIEDTEKDLKDLKVFRDEMKSHLNDFNTRLDKLID